MNEYNFIFTNLILSLVLTWGIGLSWALVVRFLLARKPISKRSAIILTSVFWLLNLVIFVALGSQSKSHFALFLVAWASYYIMHKGYRPQNLSDRQYEGQQEENKPLEIQNQTPDEIISPVVSDTLTGRENVATEQADTVKIAHSEETKSGAVAHGQTIGTDKEQMKWLVLALLVFILIGIIVVRFSNTPAATQAGDIFDSVWVDIEPNQGQKLEVLEVLYQEYNAKLKEFSSWSGSFYNEKDALRHRLILTEIELIQLKIAMLEWQIEN